MYIVTGGAGFIGSAFVRTLNDKGITDILVVDNLGCSEKWKNLSNKQIIDYLHKDQFFQLIREDRLAFTPKAVFHLGACSSTTEQDAEYMMQNNYRSTRTLASWALKKNIRLIYASSAATYGNGEEGFSDDDQICASLRPLNVYALSKQLFDLWALQTGAANKMVGIKYFNVFGPNEFHKEDMTSVVFKAFHQIQETGKVRLFKSHRPDFGDGEQKRDFVYVKDCCEVMFWFLENPSVNGIFNLGTGNARTWKDLVNAVFAAMNREPQIEFIDMPEKLREKYQYFTQAEMTKLENAGCNIPFSSLEDAVKDYVQNHLNEDFPYW